jgi:hypothetical protein
MAHARTLRVSVLGVKVPVGPRCMPLLMMHVHSLGPPVPPHGLSTSVVPPWGMCRAEALAALDPRRLLLRMGCKCEGARRTSSAAAASIHQQHACGIVHACTRMVRMCHSCACHPCMAAALSSAPRGINTFTTHTRERYHTHTHSHTLTCTRTPIVGIDATLA